MSSYNVKMRDPATGKTEIVTPQNALDLEQHLGWQRVANVRLKEPAPTAQDVLDNPKQRRASAAQSSVEPDEKVSGLPVVDADEALKPELDEEKVEPDDTDPDQDPPSTRDAIAAGR